MPPCTSIRQQRHKAVSVVCGIAAVAVIHAVAQLLLYRTRVRGELVTSDLVLFAVPALTAWAAYFMVFRRLGRTRPLPASIAAFAVTCVSFWAGMIAALDRYGS